VFPVKVEGKTLGVFAFQSHEIRKPDAHLLATAREIGNQVGGFLQRQPVEHA
jgi:hypothetical protein